MRITFAYPRKVAGRNYGPDETVDVDDTTGRQLIADGVARPAAVGARAAPRRAGKRNKSATGKAASPAHEPPQRPTDTTTDTTTETRRAAGEHEKE